MGRTGDGAAGCAVYGDLDVGHRVMGEARDNLADQGNEDHDDRFQAANGRQQWAEMPGFLRPTGF